MLIVGIIHLVVAIGLVAVIICDIVVSERNLAIFQAQLKARNGSKTSESEL